MSTAYINTGVPAFQPITLTIEFTTQEDVDNLHWLCNSSINGIQAMADGRLGHLTKEKIESVSKTCMTILRSDLADYVTNK
jgi:hypothetical protein